MTIRASDRPAGPQVPPMRGAASLGKGTSRRARGPPVDRQDDCRKYTPGIDRPTLFRRKYNASGINRPIVARHAEISTPSAITITGIGDHLRPERPIAFTGMHTSNPALRSRELIERTSGLAQKLIPASTNPSCETPRATRQCSRIEDIFAPIHSQALS
jgi:hypothetical protein